ncbi:MAG: hypothetical protein NVSMB6_18180 [Burkholderiaceae bacterium]
MDKLEAFHMIAAQAACGELTFPTNVHASLKIQHALDDPDCHIGHAVKLVSTDPLLSARVVALANSAAYNATRREVTNVQAAVSRLGFRTLRTLVASMIVQQFSSMLTNPALRAKASQLWQHSAHVAALAYVLSKRITREDPETAFFAGVVHEVGGFYLISRVEEFPGLLDGVGEDWRAYGERAIGHAVMKKLAVPENIQLAMEEVWFGSLILPLVPRAANDEGSAAGLLGDTVRLAKDLAPVRSPFGLEGEMEASVTSIAATLDFECGTGTLQGILLESAEEVRSLTQALLIS